MRSVLSPRSVGWWVALESKMVSRRARSPVCAAPGISWSTLGGSSKRTCQRWGPGLGGAGGALNFA